ncbi:MAG: UDP-glucose 4-epimerase GalE [Nitrospinota bacterium]|nr:UDP-glucose 4-epimerase GalE [Nitrospinota bacterium]
MARILVTGGAGYIGSHVAMKLMERGHRVVVYDNLSTGQADAAPGAEMVVADLADMAALDRICKKRSFDAVMSFAASVVAPESVQKPLSYYANNTCATLVLLQALSTHQIGALVYSSTAAVYGAPETTPTTEDSPLNPVNPYGASKMMSERMIEDVGRAMGLGHVILRYFNVAGADPKGRIGQTTENATHLVKVACQAALGARPGVTIYGTDYPTPDGTGVRDYIHVDDLASAHLLALDYLLDGGAPRVYNCGYGHGHSVREVIEAARRVSGKDFPVEEGPRRPGDPPMLVASSERIKEELGWAPEHDDLDFIISTALDWEKKLQRG